MEQEIGVVDLEIRNRMAKGHKEKYGTELSDAQLNAFLASAKIIKMDPLVNSFEDINAEIMRRNRIANTLMGRTDNFVGGGADARR